MPTHDEIQRIAAMMHAARPDWHPGSLVTFLTTNHQNRTYRDLAIAGAVVATDPRTKTPKLLNQHGAWWVAAQAATNNDSTTDAPRCSEPGHTSYFAHNCGYCKAEQLETVRLNQADRTPAVPPERINQILGRSTT